MKRTRPTKRVGDLRKVARKVVRVEPELIQRPTRTPKSKSPSANDLIREGLDQRSLI